MTLNRLRWLLALCLMFGFGFSPASAAPAKKSTPAKTATVPKPAPKAAPKPAPKPAPLQARVSLTVRDGQIVARYRLSRPVERLPLQRLSPLRDDAWKLSSGYIVLDGNSLITNKGRTFSSFDVTLSAVPRGPARDYDPVVRFGDGGLAVYTGQFVIAENTGSTIFDIAPPAGSGFVLFGRRHTEPLEWTVNPGDDGTIVYFGNSPMAETRDGLAVLDAGMPQWLFNHVRQQFPKLVDFYAARLGPNPVHRPFILVSADTTSGTRSGVSGEVLEGLLQLRLTGPEWQQPTRQQAQSLDWILAHELAHFWNALKGLDSPRAWMHEGASEAFAFRALHATGALSADQVAKGYSEALGHCSWMLGSKSVNTAFMEGQRQAPHQCGAVMSLLTDRALQQARPGSDLFSFWRQLLDQARAQNGRYTQEMYFQLLTEQLGNPSLSDFLRGMANDGFGGASSLARWFSGLGMPLQQANDRTDPVLSQLVYHRLLEELQRQDCSDTLSFSVFDQEVELDGQPQCRTLQGPLRIVGIAGYPFFDDGPGAWEAASTACREGGQVPLAVKDSQTAFLLPCTELRARPSFFRFNARQFALPAG